MTLFPLFLALVPALELTRFWPTDRPDPPRTFHTLHRQEPVAFPVGIDSTTFRERILGEWVYRHSTDGLLRRRLPSSGWRQLGARLVFERVDEERVVKPLFYGYYHNARRGELFEGIRYRVVDSTRGTVLGSRAVNDTCYPIGKREWFRLDSTVSLLGWCDSDKSADPTILYLAGDTLVIDQRDGKLTIFLRR